MSALPLANQPLSADMTLEDVKMLPGPLRAPWVENIRIKYPLWQTILQAIEDAHTLNAVAAEPQCLMVVGPTGAGKSTLADSYAAQYPATYTNDSVHRPVVQATVISRSTTKNLATSILMALGDPRAAYGTEGNMTLRIVQQFRQCGVEMLILDEIQHLVDAESMRVMQNASNSLKWLIKETGVACVLVGLQGEAEQVINVNPQLGRLFGDPYVLEPYRWDPADPQTITEFRKLLAAIETQLPLNEKSSLHDKVTAQLCYLACGGVVGYLMRLLRQATRLTLKQGHEKLDLNLLAQAYDASLAPLRRSVPNPFAAAIAGAGTAPSQPSAPVAHPVERNPQATSNRGKARKPRQPRLKDMLA
jgi:energy-coupling factor transporter ATP-binding protein EcfA2